MKKILLPLIAILLLFSCQRKKPEFIESQIYSNFFLLKNPPEDSLVEKLIKDFLIKKPPLKQKQTYYLSFYNYTSNTKFFLENREIYGGLGGDEISMYGNDLIATFGVIKCNNDTTKRVGKIVFYNKWINEKVRDTLIYKCN